MGVKLLAEERLNVKGKYDLRDYIKKKGYDFAKDFLERLHKLLELVELIDDTKNTNLVRMSQRNTAYFPMTRSHRRDV